MRDFFGCYLLTSLNPKNKGRTYIGFTVNPQRRIRQHNGEIVSGAHKTKRHRPWEMVLVVYGFSTQVQALQFEWAWQHPLKSKAVRAVAESLGTRKMAGTKGKVALLMDMLNLAPWCHFPLTVQVLSSSYSGLRAAAKQPPAHMRVEVAPLEALPARVDDGLDEDAEREDELDNGNSSGSGEDDSSLTVLDVAQQDVSAQPAAISNKCALCSRCADATWLACTCGCRTHTECLAQHFLAASGNGSRLPSSGACPACAKQWAWVDMLARSENKGWQQSRRGRAAKTSKAPAKPAKAAIATGSTAVELDADSAEGALQEKPKRKPRVRKAPLPASIPAAPGLPASTSGQAAAAMAVVASGKSPKKRGRKSKDAATAAGEAAVQRAAAGTAFEPSMRSRSGSPLAAPLEASHSAAGVSNGCGQQTLTSTAVADPGTGADPGSVSKPKRKGRPRKAATVGASSLCAAPTAFPGQPQALLPHTAQAFRGSFREHTSTADPQHAGQQAAQHGQRRGTASLSCSAPQHWAATGCQGHWPVPNIAPAAIVDLADTPRRPGPSSLSQQQHSRLAAPTGQYGIPNMDLPDVVIISDSESEPSPQRGPSQQPVVEEHEELTLAQRLMQRGSQRLLDGAETGGQLQGPVPGVWVAASGSADLAPSCFQNGCLAQQEVEAVPNSAPASPPCSVEEQARPANMHSLTTCDFSSSVATVPGRDSSPSGTIMASAEADVVCLVSPSPLPLHDRLQHGLQRAAQRSTACQHSSQHAAAQSFVAGDDQVMHPAAGSRCFRLNARTLPAAGGDKPFSDATDCAAGQSLVRPDMQQIQEPAAAGAKRPGSATARQPHDDGSACLLDAPALRRRAGHACGALKRARQPRQPPGCASTTAAGVIHFAIRKSGGIPSLRPIKTSSGGVGCFDLSLPRAAVTDTGPAAHQEQHNQHPLINGMGSGRFGADDWEGTPVGAVPDALVCSSPECAASPMPLRRRLQQRLASSCLGAENGVICLLE